MFSASIKNVKPVCDTCELGVVERGDGVPLPMAPVMRRGSGLVQRARIDGSCATMSGQSYPYA